MTKSNIKTIIHACIERVWEVVVAVDMYTWRSDLSKTEVLNEEKFIEYTKGGYPTTFTITEVKPYERFEFDIENTNMKGHWVGIFTSIGNDTEIDFTEYVTVKKFWMKPFVKFFLKNQQVKFIKDLKKELDSKTHM